MGRSRPRSTDAACSSLLASSRRRALGYCARMVVPGSLRGDEMAILISVFLEASSIIFIRYVISFLGKNRVMQ